MSTEFLYFDMGNVLLSFSNERMFRQIAEIAGVDTAAVQELLDSPSANGEKSILYQFEAGARDADGIYDFFCQQTGTRPDREALFEAACDMFSPIDETIELVQSLHSAGNQLGVLSNTNELHWAFVTDGRYPFLTERFAKHALSFEAKSMKPDRAVYGYAIELAGVPAEQVFFTDDKPENVAGAQAAGIDAVLFESAGQLRAELQQRSVAGA